MKNLCKKILLICSMALLPASSSFGMLTVSSKNVVGTLQKGQTMLKNSFNSIKNAWNENKFYCKSLSEKS